MKIGPRYIGDVNYASIISHLEKIGITDQFKIKMNPVNFDNLVEEYAALFQMDFNTIRKISGIDVESFDSTPVNRICIVEKKSDACGI